MPCDKVVVSFSLGKLYVGLRSRPQFDKRVNREEKSLRHVTMVAKFLVLQIWQKKTKKTEMYVSCVTDCTQSQNGSPYFSSIVGQWKWPPLSRKSVEIQKFCSHGNVTSGFSL